MGDQPFTTLFCFCFFDTNEYHPDLQSEYLGGQKGHKHFQKEKKRPQIGWVHIFQSCMLVLQIKPK